MKNCNKILKISLIFLQKNSIYSKLKIKFWKYKRIIYREMIKGIINLSKWCNSSLICEGLFQFKEKIFLANNKKSINFYYIILKVESLDQIKKYEESKINEDTKINSASIIHTPPVLTDARFSQLMQRSDKRHSSNLNTSLMSDRTKSKAKERLFFQIKEVEIQELTQDYLLSLIFSNFPKNQILQKLSSFKENQCNEQIKKGELCFKCYDCEIRPSLQYICEPCFDNVLHKNHVFIYFIMKEQGGICYCGDSQNMKPTSTCNKHNNKQHDNSALQSLDQSFRDNFTYQIKNQFFIIFQILDYFQQLVELNQTVTENKIQIFFENLTEFLIFLEHLLNENAGFQYLLSSILLDEQQNELKHTCNKPEYQIQIKTNENCKCSVLQNLFLYSSVINDIQIKWRISLLLIRLRGILKEDLVKCYGNTYKINTKFENDHSISPLSFLYKTISKKLTSYLVEETDFLKQMLDVYKQNSTQMILDSQLQPYIHILENQQKVLQKISQEYPLHNKTILMKIINQMQDFSLKFSGNDFSNNRIMMVLEQKWLILLGFFMNIENQDNLESYIKEILQEINFDLFSTSSVRSLCLIKYAFYFKTNQTLNLQSFMIKQLNLSYFQSICLKNCVKMLSICLYIEDPFIKDLLIEKEDSMTKLQKYEIDNYYTSSETVSFFDLDLGFLQELCLSIDGGLVIQNIYDVLSLRFFNDIGKNEQNECSQETEYENYLNEIENIQGNFYNQTQQLKDLNYILVSLKDIMQNDYKISRFCCMLELISCILFDRSPLVNIFTYLHNETEWYENKEFLESLEILINSRMFFVSSLSFQDLKDFFSKKFINNKIELTKFVTQIFHFQNLHLIQKEENKNNYDLSNFNRDQNIKSQIQQSVHNHEFLIGNEGELNKDQMVYKIRQNFAKDGFLTQILLEIINILDTVIADGVDIYYQILSNTLKILSGILIFDKTMKLVEFNLPFHQQLARLILKFPKIEKTIKKIQILIQQNKFTKMEDGQDQRKTKAKIMMEKSIIEMQKKQNLIINQYQKELQLIDLDEKVGNIFKCLQCQSNDYSQDYMVFCANLNVDNIQIYMKKCNDVQINIQSCYHVFHMNCFSNCHNLLNNKLISEGGSDYACPMCRQIGNCTIPDAYSVLLNMNADDFDDDRIIEISKSSLIKINKIYDDFPSNSKDDQVMALLLQGVFQDHIQNPVSQIDQMQLRLYRNIMIMVCVQGQLQKENLEKIKTILQQNLNHFEYSQLSVTTIETMLKCISQKLLITPLSNLKLFLTFFSQLQNSLLKKLIEYYQNEILDECKIIKKIIPFLRILCGIKFIIDFNIKYEDIVFFHNSNPDEENDLLEYFLGISLKTLLTGQKFISKIRKNGGSGGTELIPLAVRQKFTINLPHSYDQLIQFTMNKKCSKCKGYPITENSYFYLCLICSNVICSQKCKTDLIQPKGNLNLHAYMSHYNQTIYINVNDGVVWIQFKEKFFQFGSIYFKECVPFSSQLFTQPYKTARFQEYRLDPPLLDKLQQLISNHQIPRYMGGFSYESQKIINNSQL